MNFFLLSFSQQPETDSLTIMFVGDIMSHGPQIKSAYDPIAKTYDYTESFRYVKNIFKQADFVVGNLETPLGIKPYKGFPVFSAPPALVVACKDAGINVLATANNHACDKKKKGILNTLDILDSLSISHFGTYRDVIAQDSLTPLLLKKGDFRIALLNYTYGTNGMPISPPTRVNLIDTLKIKRDIDIAKQAKSNLIISFMHWGTQYQDLANKSQKKLVTFLKKNAVNMIVGAHPHVVQPMIFEKDTLKNKTSLTAYSLGNFLSNQRYFRRDGSLILKIKLRINEQNRVKIQKVSYIPIWVYKYKKEKRNHFEILPVKIFKNKPEYFLDYKDYSQMLKYSNHLNQLMKKHGKNIYEESE